MGRPGCVVRALELEAERRPRMLPAEGVGSEVRALGNSTGLRRMGVWLRAIDPGKAGTHRHFHEVEEEWAYVLSGTGTVRIGPHRIRVRPGSFAGFPPGPRPHHFVADAEEPLVILEGGERRPDEDSGWYVDLGIRWERGKYARTDIAPPPGAGEAAQCFHVDELALRDFDHPVDPRARRVMRSLHTEAGLVRQAVRWSRVRAGDRSTAYHTHDRTDEWIYVLEGRAAVRIGDQRFEVGAGEFVAHPAGGPAHVMEPETDLTYLMGGMIDADDVVIYPEAGVQRRRGQLEPIS